MKLSKILSIFAIVIMILSIAGSFVLAYDPSGVTLNYDNAGDVTDLGGKIVGIIQVVGSVVAVGILVVLGIKYMMGSTEEKAEYKKTLVPYLVGAVLIFAASNIAKIVFDAVQGL